LACVKVLVENGVCCDGCPLRRPVVDAAAEGHLDIVRYLIDERKVEIDTCNSNRVTPLGAAVVCRHRHGVDWLVGRGALGRRGMDLAKTIRGVFYAVHGEDDPESSGEERKWTLEIVGLLLSNFGIGNSKRPMGILMARKVVIQLVNAAIEFNRLGVLEFIAARIADIPFDESTQEALRGPSKKGLFTARGCSVRIVVLLARIGCDFDQEVLLFIGESWRVRLCSANARRPVQFCVALLIRCYKAGNTLKGYATMTLVKDMLKIHGVDVEKLLHEIMCCERTSDMRYCLECILKRLMGEGLAAEIVMRELFKWGKAAELEFLFQEKKLIPLEVVQRAIGATEADTAFLDVLVRSDLDKEMHEVGAWDFLCDRSDSWTPQSFARLAAKCRDKDSQRWLLWSFVSNLDGRIGVQRQLDGRIEMLCNAGFRMVGTHDLDGRLREWPSWECLQSELERNGAIVPECRPGSSVLIGKKRSRKIR
jgi:hypothetical protein